MVFVYYPVLDSRSALGKCGFVFIFFPHFCLLCNLLLQLSPISSCAPALASHWLRRLGFALNVKMEDVQQTTTSIDKLAERLEQLLAINFEEKFREFTERFENVEKKLDKIAENDSSASPSEAAPKKRERATSGNNGAGCQYVMRSGKNKDKPCGKRTKDGTNYCNEHPDGLTRAQWKKKYEDGGEPAPTTSSSKLKVEPYDDDSDYSKIVSPTALLNIIVTTSQPHQAVCKIENENTNKVRLLKKNEKELLDKLKVSVMSEDSAIEVIEELEFTIDADQKSEKKEEKKASVKGKEDKKKEEKKKEDKKKDDKKKDDKKKKKDDSEDEDEDDSEDEEEDEEEKPSKNKAKTLLNRSMPKKPVSLRTKDETDEDEEDED